MIDFLKRLDIFGHPIGVHYKGQTTHNTIFGSMLSLLIILWVLAYAAFTFMDTVHHTNQEANTNRIKADLNEQGPVDLEEFNF